MTAPGKHIERAWLDYRAAVIPADARANQVIESRRAFYAGAWQLYTSILAALTPGSEPTEADLHFMRQLDAELRAFNDNVRAGVA